jgi:hypothetical protein
MSDEISASLFEQAQQFADVLTNSLQGALPNAPEATAEVVDDRVVVAPREAVRLLVDGEHLANLVVRFRCQEDSRGEWLAVESSSYALIAQLDRIPVIRFDYLRHPGPRPGAHIQVHAHRGALTHLLSKSGHAKPHDISSLHIPVGGARLRPCLEDVIQFLIAECGFDAVPGWQARLNEGRAEWRRGQVKALVRDFPAEAVDTLERLGFTVAPPAEGLPATLDKALHTW